MESKPSQVTQDEKKQKTDAEPVLLTIDSCKQNLELTRKAALLSLLRFEQAWNPQGANQSHLYEDLRDATVETNKQRVKKVEKTLRILQGKEKSEKWIKKYRDLTGDTGDGNMSNFSRGSVKRV